MSHLTLEALSRLVDEAPTTEERDHLDGCPRCREELDALRRQTETLGALPDMSPPPDLWPELQARLREERLVRSPPRVRGFARIAAALALFVTGAATGFAVRGPVDTVTVPAAAPTPGQEPAPTLASAPDPMDTGDVAADVERAQESFAAALDRYMMATSSEAPDPAARLAALDNIVMTTAEALNESPADPVINSYHLTAVAQRNELLRQIAASDQPVF